MTNIIKSNFIRNKRSPILWISVLAPLLYVLAFAIYIAGPNSIRGEEIYSFFGGFVVLSSFALSFFIPLCYEADREAGFYTNDLRFPISRKKIYLGKFLFILILFALIVSIASIGFLIALSIIGINSLGIKVNISLVALSFITLLPLIPTYQFLTLKLGRSISVLAGIFITLAALLFGTTALGEIIWPIIPFVWPIKIISLMAYSKIELSQVMMFLIMAILLTIVFLFFTSIWFKKWDVYMKTED